MTIIVIDDDQNMRSLVRSTLAGYGCKSVLATGDAREALRLFATNTIDLILLDWNMEPMSGLDFLREIRRPERDIRVPVIMLTANSDARDMMQAQPLRINSWLIKPVTAPELMSRIVKAVSLPEACLAVDGALAAELAALAERYKTKLVDDLRALDEAIGAIPTHLDPSYEWRSIERTLHNIKGQAGSFGFELITAIAAIGMELLRAAEGDPMRLASFQSDLLRCLIALVEAMRLVMQNHIKGDGGPVGSRLLEKLTTFTTHVRKDLVGAPNGG